VTWGDKLSKIMFFFLMTLAALVGTTAAAGSGPADDGAHEVRACVVRVDIDISIHCLVRRGPGNEHAARAM